MKGKIKKKKSKRNGPTNSSGGSREDVEYMNLRWQEIFRQSCDDSLDADMLVESLDEVFQSGGEVLKYFYD